MLNHLKQHFGSRRTGGHGGLDIARHIGPGLLVTVGFIDPGNWASNMAAGSQFGYALLWIVTLSTIMLIVLQHNAAHLGIATGTCLAEATTRYLPRFVGRTVLTSAYLATIATAMAEVLGGAIALQMLFGLSVRAGCIIVAAASIAMLMTSSYKRAERWIIAFVGVVGLSFLAELALVKVDWPQAATSWITPSMPTGSAAIIVSVLGAVVMPHNLFLHSEVIQSMHFEGQGERVIEERLRYELFDTLFSMGVGWAINSAMVILAATTFFARGIVVDNLTVAAATLSPILGPASSTIFAVALLFAGISSSVTAGMAAACSMRNTTSTTDIPRSEWWPVSSAQWRRAWSSRILLRVSFGVRRCCRFSCRLRSLCSYGSPAHSASWANTPTRAHSTRCS